MFLTFSKSYDFCCAKICFADEAEVDFLFPGYRQVPLLTKKGVSIPSAGLFVHIMLMDEQ